MTCSRLSAIAVLIASLGSSQESPKRHAPASRTAWGAPNLSGVWTNATLTPLERPEGLGEQAFYSEAEVAALEAEAERRFADGPARAGDPGTYNDFWWDRGTRVVDDRRTSLIVSPPDGRIPWKPEALGHHRRSRARYGVGPYHSWLDFDTGERCLTDGLPMVPTQGYNMNYQILQTPDHVVILHEMYHEYRVIPLDGRPRLSARIGQWLGDARGRWEGDTLVVETTNFAAKADQWWAASWRAARPSLRLVERFTRVDAETLDYRFTMEDPESFTEPWTAAIPMTTNQTERGVTVGRLFEYACHEGNYSIENVLRGAQVGAAESTK